VTNQGKENNRRKNGEEMKRYEKRGETDGKGIDNEGGIEKGMMKEIEERTWMREDQRHFSLLLGVGSKPNGDLLHLCTESAVCEEPTSEG
jgi:hypothetical protein